MTIWAGLSWYDFGGLVAAITGTMLLIIAIWGALIFRKRMRELGEIIAAQSERHEGEDPR